MRLATKSQKQLSSQAACCRQCDRRILSSFPWFSSIVEQMRGWRTTPPPQMPAPGSTAVSQSRARGVQQRAKSVPRARLPVDVSAETRGPLVARDTSREGSCRAGPYPLALSGTVSLFMPRHPTLILCRTEEMQILQSVAGPYHTVRWQQQHEQSYGHLCSYSMQ
jgi:hypothetical protein